MTVYVDDMKAPLGRMVMCHMIADTEDGLAEMAQKIGVNLKWWQHKGTKRSHFDICKAKRALAVKFGAMEVNSRELVKIIQSKT